jgi:anti-sigma regulatory factor (Ser/Thr protein kinase)
MSSDAAKVGLLSSEFETTRQVLRAIYSCGNECAAARTVEALLAHAESSPIALFIIDVDEPAPARVAIDWIRAHRPDVPVLLLSVSPDKRALFDLLAAHGLNNLVAKHGAIRAAFPVLNEHELLVTTQKLLTADIFGIDKYISGWGIRQHRHVMTNSGQKYAILDAFRRFMTNLGCRAGLVGPVATVVDELLMNAVFHAPTTPDGERKYEHLDRDRSFDLLPTETVELTFACDGRTLMFAVNDQFGSLDRSTIMRYMERSLAAQIEVESKENGAGLGLPMAFRSVHQMVFNVRRNRRTEVIGGLYLASTRTTGEAEAVEKSINIFYQAD